MFLGFEESEIDEMVGDVADETEINFEEFMNMVVGRGAGANSIKSIYVFFSTFTIRLNQFLYIPWNFQLSLSLSLCLSNCLSVRLSVCLSVSSLLQIRLTQGPSLFFLSFF